MKLLIQSQTSTVKPFEFGNGQVSSPQNIIRRPIILIREKALDSLVWVVSYKRQNS